MMEVDEIDEDTAVVAPPVKSIEDQPTLKQEDEGHEDSEDDDADANDTVEVTTGTENRALSLDQYKALKNIADVLTNYKIPVKGDEDYYPSILFRRIPNRRLLPDYHQVIQEPSAISTLKGKIQRKQYSGIPEFVRDFALIVHNAQVYNRPNSAPVRDVFRLDTVFRAEMRKMVELGLAKSDEIEFPDLGPIPAATPEPDRVSGDDDGEDDGEDEDDEDEDDSDDDGQRRRGRNNRPSISGRKSLRDDDDQGGKGKRRGRPPKVDTPLEARMKAVLKAIRRPKDDNGLPRIRHFERLPDKAEHTHYYTEIKNPIALEIIKRKQKRKKYHSMDQFLKDLLLMFENARTYNEDFSEIYEDANELGKETLRLVEEEMAKPDTEFVMEDGRLPLPDGILYRNEMWKVGDWIHLQNPNDVTKPIVAQIYRTWEDPEGQKWINACWYYRPEQTVHQIDKHFFPNEVVKTGQYRDHQIEEVIDRCFVMFVTRYSRGRPRNLNPSVEVYVCEARYNEEKHKFNKIKTWASCLPDEVRDKDYEMDLFDSARRIRKIPSPIKHTLKADASENDELPQPTWGNPHAPPILGAVHKHARDENQSPPPEPTPPPSLPPHSLQPQPVRTPSIPNMNHQAAQRPYERPSSSQNPPQPLARQPSNPNVQTPAYRTTSATPGAQYGQRPAYQNISAQPYVAPATPSGQPPMYHPQHPPHVQQANHAQPSLAAAHPTNYAGATPQNMYPRPPTNTNQAPIYQAYPANPNQLPPDMRAREVYVLSDAANESIPKSIRDMYPQDDEGRVLFFTKPPMVQPKNVQGRSASEAGQPLQHTDAYLAAKAKRMEAIAERKRQLQEKIAKDKAEEERPSKRLKPGSLGEERDPDGRIKADPIKAAKIREEYAAAERARGMNGTSESITNESPESQFLNNLKHRMDEYQKQWMKDQVKWYIDKFGDRALEIFNEDCKKHRKWMKEAEDERKREKEMEEGRRKAEHADDNGIEYKDFWTGLYLDDYDPRY